MKHNEMMSSSDTFVNTSCDLSVEPMNYETLNMECTDPLQEINSDFETKCYRMDSVVFAEPLETVLNGSDCLKDNGGNQDKMTIIDNVIVQKRKGSKYNKYLINIEDPTNLCCPQSNCKRKFTTVKLLKAHIRKVHCADKSRYVCDVCGDMFACQYLLVRHSVVHSGGTVQCHVCDKVLSERTSLSAHLRTHSGIKPHTCSICNKAFARQSTLNLHIKFVHRQGKIQCLKCNERFETRSQWNRHTSNHHRSTKLGGAPSS